MTNQRSNIQRYLDGDTTYDTPIAAAGADVLEAMDADAINELIRISREDARRPCTPGCPTCHFGD